MSAEGGRALANGYLKVDELLKENGGFLLQEGPSRGMQLERVIEELKFLWELKLSK